MQSYELRYFEGRGQPEQRLSFSAVDPARALPLLHRTLCDGFAQLWHGGKLLCALRSVCLGSSEVWLVCHPGGPKRPLLDDLSARQAYVAGASRAVEAIIVYLDPGKAMAMRTWLNELDDWRRGEPPTPPRYSSKARRQLSQAA